MIFPLNFYSPRFPRVDAYIYTQDVLQSWIIVCAVLIAIAKNIEISINNVIIEFLLLQILLQLLEVILLQPLKKYYQ